MVHKSLQKYVDCQDIRSIRYVFRDCLDIDPTFAQYEDDYEYSKNVEGLFEPHRELSRELPQSAWDMEYWLKLKDDLIQNFSMQRLNHMRDVAKVVFADKIRMAEQRAAELQKQRLMEEAAEGEKLQREADEREKLQREADEREKLQREAAEREKLQREVAEREELQREAAEREKLQREAAEREKLQREAAERSRATQNAQQDKVVRTYQENMRNQTHPNIDNRKKAMGAILVTAAIALILAIILVVTVIAPRIKTAFLSASVLMPKYGDIISNPAALMR